MKKKLLTFLLFVLCTPLFAQVGPPSLAIGAGKVLAEKGNLDAELIQSIIATKQDEVRQEFAKRTILKSRG